MEGVKCRSAVEDYARRRGSSPAVDQPAASPIRHSSAGWNPDGDGMGETTISWKKPGVPRFAFSHAAFASPW